MFRCFLEILALFVLPTMKPDGPLRGLNGFLPMAACVGGVIGPAIVYV